MTHIKKEDRQFAIGRGDTPPVGRLGGGYPVPAIGWAQFYANYGYGYGFGLNYQGNNNSTANQGTDSNGTDSTTGETAGDSSGGDSGSM